MSFFNFFIEVRNRAEQISLTRPEPSDLRAKKDNGRVKPG